MRKLNILKTILDFFWWSALLFLTGLILFLPFYLLEAKPEIEIRGQKILNHNTFTKTIVTINVISSLVFL